MSILSDLRILTGEAGVSGDERAASEKAAELLRNYAEDVSVDDFGNVTGFVRSDDPNAKTLMLAAHIDRVGLAVTYIEDDGFIRAGACGSPDIRTLPAQSVTVYGKKPVRGVIAALPPHVSKEKNVPEIGELAIDLGMTKEEAEKLVSPGDKITIDGGFRELCGRRVSAPAIDDRGGVCAILAALELLRGKKTRFNIAACFTVCEETGSRGAKMLANRIRPDEAIAVDVSFGNTPDSSKKETAPLGSGAMIGYSAALDREMSETLEKLAVSGNIPFTREIMPGSTGTDADSIAVSGSGVRCCTVSFPIRYMHTSAETADLNDIEAAARLIARYAEVRDDI